jgi:hypothetical protein
MQPVGVRVTIRERDELLLEDLQKECLMAVAIQQISPVAHLPLALGVVRKLKVAPLIDTFCPSHPAHVLSCGRGVEALLLAILDGHHALYKAVCWTHFFV